MHRIDKLFNFCARTSGRSASAVGGKMVVRRRVTDHIRIVAFGLSTWHAVTRHRGSDAQLCERTIPFVSRRCDN